MIKKETWDVRYDALKTIYDETGSLDIKNSENRYLGDIDLYDWTKQLRAKRKKEELTEEQINLLDKINFPWNTARSMTWDDKYQLAKEYYEKHGTVDILPSVTLDNGFKLGVWIQSQKIDFKNNKVSPEHLPLLLALDFDKFAINKKEAKWEKHLALAKKYHSIYGTINIEDNYMFEGFNLGNWISNAVAFYNRGILPQERIDQLEELGMVWSRNNNEEYAWEKKYAQLKMFLMEHDIKELTTENHYALYMWLDKQRLLIENNELPEEKFNKLSELNISLERRTKNKDNWDYNYNLAKEYYEKHGHLLIPKEYKSANGENLGYWITVQRMAYNGNGRWTISEEKIERLNQIGMEWRGLTEGWWDYKIAALKEYLENNENSFPMPRSFKYKEAELGKWLFDIQTKIKSNKLDPEKAKEIKAIIPDIEKIELPTDGQLSRLHSKQEKSDMEKALEIHVKDPTIEISGINIVSVKNISEANKTWIKNFESLRDYLVQNPTIPVDTDKLNNFKSNLASWLYQNINNYKLGKLRKYQVELFDSLNIDLQRLFPINLELKWLKVYDSFINILKTENIVACLRNYPQLAEFYYKNLKAYQNNELNIFRKEKFEKLIEIINESN